MENSWITWSKRFCWLQLSALIKNAFLLGRSCQVCLIMGGLCICAQMHMCMCACTYLLFKTDVQAKNKSLVLMTCYCGLMPMSAWAVPLLAVPLYTEAIPRFDNITFRFCRTVVCFMYVSYSGYLTVSQICHFTCSSPLFFFFMNRGRQMKNSQKNSQKLFFTKG